MPSDPVYSPLPLFDRLAADADAHGSGGDARQASIGRDLARLLNTRSRLGFEAFAQSAATVVDYGVPDYSERSPVSGRDCDAIASVVRHAISVYEPRLRNVSVSMTPAPHGRAPCVLEVRADMPAAGGVRQVAFELNAGAPDAAVAQGGAHG